MQDVTKLDRVVFSDVADLCQGQQLSVNVPDLGPSQSITILNRRLRIVEKVKWLIS